jgi:Fe-S-cluster-containing hydrogenase component 2
MAKLEDHPTVRRARAAAPAALATPLSGAWLREVCREAGADDAGFVEIDRPALAAEAAAVRATAPWAKALVSFVVRMQRENVRSPARSAANVEFHHTGDAVDEAGRRIAAALEARGVRALHPSMGFPMEMDRWPGRIWVVSHKLVAVEAGLGHMGIHRNVIHPRFGNFVLLGTVVVDAEIDAYDRPLDYNPCLECKLCVAACPVGAIGADGHFAFSSCHTHNYREFMGGFSDWVEKVAAGGGARAYRRRVDDRETVSVWQSLSFGANYKAAYCMAVCPAGEEVIGPWLADRKGHLETVVKPLQRKEEPVYVVPGSDAEAYVTTRYPHKTPRRVGNGLRTRSIPAFLAGLPRAFQRGRAGDLDATYHFTFTGAEPAEATVRIASGAIDVARGHVGTPSFRLTADSATWLGFLAKERSLLWALATRRIRIRGPLRLMRAFARCFPS